MKTIPLGAPAFDTLEYKDRLEENGFTEQQAITLTEVHMSVANNLEKRAANKTDIEISKNELKQDISDTKAELKQDINHLADELRTTTAELRQEIIETKKGLELKIHKTKNELEVKIDNLRGDIKADIIGIEAVLYKTLHKHFIITIGAVLACNTLLLAVISYIN